MMTPIRIAHITTIDFSLRHLLLNQLLSLKEVGFDVTGISSPGPDVDFLQEHGIRHISVPMTRSITPARDLLSLYHLYAVLKKEKFDIVHTHNPKPGLLGQLAARMSGTPFVVNTLHGFYFHENMRTPERKLYVALEKIAARCSDVILSQNSEDVKTAIEEGVCPENRIQFLGNGIDVERFDPNRVDAARVASVRREFGIPESSLVVGFVGRLVREKGISELLDAAWCAKQNDIDVRFLFVGPHDTGKKDAITPEIAREYQVEDLCIFTGMRHDMPEMYAMMDLFVLPSYREGFPRAPMEAAAMGVPVVVTDIRGCREAVADGVNGVLVPAKSSAQLAGAVIDLLRNPVRRRELAQNGRKVAKQRFDERKVFEAVHSHYRTLLKTVHSNGHGGESAVPTGSNGHGKAARRQPITT